jgi:hypothetical protein
MNGRRKALQRQAGWPVRRWSLRRTMGAIEFDSKREVRMDDTVFVIVSLFVFAVIIASVWALEQV